MADKTVVNEPRAVEFLRGLQSQFPDLPFDGWDFTGPSKVTVHGSARRALLVEKGRLIRLDLSGLGLHGRLAVGGLPHLEELVIRGARLSILEVEDLPALEAVFLDDVSCDSGQPLLEFKDLPSLARLRINSSRIWNTSFVEDLTGLVELELGGNEIADLAPLRRLRNLRTLVLSENEIEDLSPLGAVEGLERLDLRYNRLIDLRQLSGFGSLACLKLCGNREAGRIEPLAALPDLSELWLSDMGLDDLGGLAEAFGLTVLIAPGNRITDVSFLGGLDRLLTLDLSDNSIDDVSGLRSCPLLVRLGLSGNEIEDVGPLEGLASLRELDLSFNAIRDARPLSGLVNLVVLDLKGNALTDASPLSGLASLTLLNIGSNQIEDFGPVRSLPNLTRLSTVCEDWQDDEDLYEVFGPHVQDDEDDGDGVDYGDYGYGEGDYVEDAYEARCEDDDDYEDRDGAAPRSAQPPPGLSKLFEGVAPAELGDIINTLIRNGVTINGVTRIKGEGPGGVSGMLLKCSVETGGPRGVSDVDKILDLLSPFRFAPADADDPMLKGKVVEGPPPDPSIKYYKRLAALAGDDAVDERRAREAVEAMNQMFLLISYNPDKFSVH